MNMVRDLLGTELPIIQAPMAGVQGSTLALAVAQAGGLGSLPCAMLSVEALRGELTILRAQTTRPINLNFFCHTQPAPDQAREAAWRTLLAPYYAEFGIDPRGITATQGRMPFSTQLADMLETFKPALISFHFGLPSADLLARVRSWGTKILSSATTVAEALWLETQGVDAIIAQGLEAGGHRGMFLSTDVSTQLGTFALVPQIVRAVKLPVIAAGGIADAGGVRAALALGAQAVQLGTAYMLCPEASTGTLHRTALQSQVACHTALTNVFTGRPARGIMNRLMRELGPLNPAVPAFPLATTALAVLRAAAEGQGSTDFSPLWAGQNVSGCKPIAAAELTHELMR